MKNHKNILFVGPVAKQGGPAIKNRLLVSFLRQKGAKLRLWNTYDRSLKGRVGAFASILLGREKYMVVAVSHKGRNTLYPFLLLKKMISGIHYSCVVIGGKVAEGWRSLPSVLAMRHADLVTVETEGLKSILEEKYHLKNVHCMPNYKILPPMDAYPVKEERFQDEALRFLFLSNMMNEKGVRTLLNAFRRVQAKGYAATLDFYGPVVGNLDEDILTEIQACTGIRYLGAVENTQVLDTMYGYHVFVFPTEYEREGFPAVLVEAQAVGLPVIASDMAFNSELIRDGENGWIYPSGNEEELEKRITSILEDPSVLPVIAHRNKEASRQYNAGDVIAKYKEKLLEMGWPL